jgi:hypothetical protein
MFYQPLVSIREGNSSTTLSDEGVCFKMSASYLILIIESINIKLGITITYTAQ